MNWDFHAITYYMSRIVMGLVVYRHNFTQVMITTVISKKIYLTRLKTTAYSYTIVSQPSNY